MFTQVEPKQKAVDTVSFAQVTKSFRLRVSSFCFCNSETIKNEDWLGEVVALSLSQSLAPRIDLVWATCVLNPPAPPPPHPAEAPVQQRVPSGRGSKPPTSSTSGGAGTRPHRSPSGPFPLVIACPMPDPQGPKTDSAPSSTPKHPLSANPCAELWGTVISKR